MQIQIKYKNKYKERNVLVLVQLKDGSKYLPAKG